MLRNFAIRLVLWLCDHFDIRPLDETRINMGADKKARSQRWEAFAKEDGGLFDMLDKIKADYLTKMGKVAPGDAKSLEALAIGARVVDGLKSEVRSVIAEGQIAQVQEDRAARLNVAPIRKSV